MGGSVVHYRIKQISTAAATFGAWFWREGWTAWFFDHVIHGAIPEFPALSLIVQYGPPSVFAVLTCWLLLRSVDVNLAGTKSTPAIAPLFFVTTGPILVLKFPGLLVYKYLSSYGELLAPLGIIAAIEVTNNRGSPTKISTYVVDAKVGNEWIRIPNLNPANLDSFYWVNDGNLATCIPLSFSSNSFDNSAKSFSLDYGESIRGSIFLEWPKRLRDTSLPAYEMLRISIVNSQQESFVANLDPQRLDGGGESLLGPGFEMFSKGKEGMVDLSKLKVMPYTDL